MATLADIAREAGVSVNLTSYVLKKTTPPTSEKHKHILEVARRLEYVPNRAAAALSTGKTMNIALITARELHFFLSQPYFVEFLSALTEILSKRGMGLSLYSCSDRDAGDFIYNGFSDGVIWYGSPISERVAESLVQKHHPAVLIHALAPGLDCFTIDDYSSFYELLRQLYSFGHRHMAFLGTPVGMTDRKRAYLDFMQSQCDGYSHIIPLGCGVYDTIRIVRESVSEGLPDYSVIVAETDELALAAMTALKTLGIDIPGDISVTGYDDLPNAALFSPSLTTVRQNILQIATDAAERLLERIGGSHDEPRHVQYRQYPIIRDSTGAPGRSF